MDPFAILGLQPGASAEEITEAYHRRTAPLIINEGGVVELRCIKCRKLVVMRGPRLLTRLGVGRRVRAAQLRLRCTRCNVPGEIRILFPDDQIDRARSHHRLKLNDSWPDER